MSRTVRIGCGAGFWGDSAEGPAQLVRAGGIDYLVMDYLAEITMALLARARQKSPDAGYATDFVDAVMAPLLPDLARGGIRVVTNAGGINAIACRDALQGRIDEAGLGLRVAAVLGDDLGERAERFRAAGVTGMFTGEPFPARTLSVNAYLGATPIARALDMGADIVVTGRVTDSALALGPLMHEFRWKEDEFDLLAAGSLAGHVIECGAQATGGIFTDWRDVRGWDDMGFPVVEVEADGTFVVTKPDGTGGLVSTATVAEQVTYEIGDPRAYLLPDVVCDFSGVTLEQAGRDRVRVSGARGRAPSGMYKVCATWADGYRCTATLMIGGREAADKARAVADAILARVTRLLSARGMEGLRAASVEVLGAESTYGPHSRAGATREVVLKIAVAHPERDALNLFAREIYPSATSMAQGITGFAGGRPAVSPLVRLYSFLLDRGEVDVRVETTDETRAVEVNGPTGDAGAPAPVAAGDADLAPGAPTVTVPLIALAHGRAGDKGDSANVSVLARHAALVPLLRATVTEQAVAGYFSHLLEGPVTRYEWPGLHGFNFVLERALGGGGTASLRYDPQGKAYAQMLLDMPVEVPAHWVDAAGAVSPGATA